jgi:formate dehydrogenase major subunit
VMEEINTLTPSYGGITYERLEKGGLIWPCPTADHPGTPILHTHKFTRGEGVFFPIEYEPSAELPDAEYPFVLTTGRVYEHYHTGTMTRKGNALNQLYPEALAEINSEDAKGLGISSGDYIHIVSRRGSLKVKAAVSGMTDRGVAFVPFHFYESTVNELTNSALDPVSKIPELKICAVKIEKAA